MSSEVKKINLKAEKVCKSLTRERTPKRISEQKYYQSLIVVDEDMTVEEVIEKLYKGNIKEYIDEVFAPADYRYVSKKELYAIINACLKAIKKKINLTEFKI